MSKPTALQVMRIALQQYRYTESPAGSNKTKFGKAFGLNSAPWCAEYVWWSGWKAAGENQSDNPIAKSANAADIQTLTVKDKGGKYTLVHTSNNTKKKAALSKIKFGDSISFNFSGGTSRAHTGLVVGVWGNYIWCIEGNTSLTESGSQSNGGAVALRQRFYTTDVCTVRPDYKSFSWHDPQEPYSGSIPKLPARGWYEYGDKNAKALQEALAWANGYKLEIDGEIGGKTFAEMVIFQLAHGLEPDGQFGEQSLSKLTSLIKAKIGDSTGENTTVNNLPTSEKNTLQISEKWVDISAWQGKVSKADWEKAIKAGITCAMLRSSYTTQASFTLNKDKVFDHNIKTAIEAGLHIGVYHYSQAITVAEAKKEADFCLKCIEPYKDSIDLPVAFDWEFGKRLSSKVAKKNGKTKNSNICAAFCEKVKAAGYDPMIYANLTTLNNYLTTTLYKTAKIWVAQYNSACDYKYPYYLWQYTSTARIDGLTGNIDVSKLHTETKKTKADKIVSMAKKCSWKKGTSKSVYAYPSGKPTEAYKEALNKAYPDRSKWGKQPRAGASCDVAVGAVLRASGVDTKFPRGLDEVVPYLNTERGKKLWKKTTVKDKPKMKPGDVIYEEYKSSGGHISIFINETTVYNAHYKGKAYPARQSYDGHVHNASADKVFTVYRIKE